MPIAEATDPGVRAPQLHRRQRRRRLTPVPVIALKPPTLAITGVLEVGHFRRSPSSRLPAALYGHLPWPRGRGEARSPLSRTPSMASARDHIQTRATSDVDQNSPSSFSCHRSRAQVIEVPWHCPTSPPDASHQTRSKGPRPLGKGIALSHRRRTGPSPRVRMHSRHRHHGTLRVAFHVERALPMRR